MKLTMQMKQTPRFPAMIRKERKRLKLTQQQFAEMFGAESATAVSLWESGKREAPYCVIWYLYKQLHDRHEKSKGRRV